MSPRQFYASMRRRSFGFSHIVALQHRPATLYHFSNAASQPNPTGALPALPEPGGGAVLAQRQARPRAQAGRARCARRGTLGHSWLRLIACQTSPDTSGRYRLGADAPAIHRVGAPCQSRDGGALTVTPGDWLPTENGDAGRFPAPFAGEENLLPCVAGPSAGNGRATLPVWLASQHAPGGRTVECNVPKLSQNCFARTTRDHGRGKAQASLLVWR